jgi:hypothetical protein
MRQRLSENFDSKFFVAKDWEGMGKIADLPTLESLEETKTPFPHFEPLIL